MLKSQHQRSAFMLALTVFVSSGCGGGTAAPVGASAPITDSALGMAGTGSKLGGQFAGDVDDSVFGTGRIYAELAQYRDSVGGVVTFVYGSTVFIAPATFLSKGSTLIGSGGIGRVTGGLCTASETATYASHTLKGSYTSTHGCSSDTGTFSMREQCHYGADSKAALKSALKRC